jgi:DNA-binding NtrC family response regulator
VEDPSVLLASTDEALYKELVQLLRCYGCSVVPVCAAEALPSQHGALIVVCCNGAPGQDVEVALRSVEAAIRGRLNGAAPNAACGELIDGWRLIGESPSANDLRAYIAKLSSTDTNVLITGETGTGKELVAELIQQNSIRRQKPFVRINCAAIPDSLLESELFGYERGAFTGAQCARPGMLEQAGGGTVFFDEIGDMSPFAQAKILRAVESKEVQRLGAKRPLRLDIRIIAATNQDLDSAAGESLFRRDLYFRLNVARIHLAPLRERKADIPLLLGHYIQEFNRAFGRRVGACADELLHAFLRYDWPGNVRELRNAVEAAFVSLPATEVRLMHLPERMRPAPPASGPQTEQDLMLSALRSTDWNKSKAARRLRWSRMTLYRRMAKYGMVERKQQEESISREQNCHTRATTGTKL